MEAPTAEKIFADGGLHGNFLTPTKRRSQLLPERRVRYVSPERTPGVIVFILSVRYQNEAARKRDALTVSGTFDITII